MKLTYHRPTLTAAFQTVAAVVPARTPKPILQNVKLQTVGDQTVLIATDQEVGIRHVVSQIEQQGTGEALLPAKRIIEILREIRGETVTLDFSGTTVTICSGSSEFRLPVLDATEFPNVSKFDDQDFHTVPAKLLREMIRRTIFATDPESTRYALGGVFMEFVDDVTLKMVATDSRRLALVDGPCSVHGTPYRRAIPPTVPGKTLALLERSLGDTDEPVQIAVHANDVTLACGSSTIFSQLVEGRFPRWRDVVPSGCAIEIDLVAGPFQSVVRQSQIVTSEESRGVVFTFGSGLLVLKSQAADVGESRIELPIPYDGDELSIIFDPRFVVDFLKVLGPETPVTLGMNDGESAAVLQTDDGYSYVIMPLSPER